MVESLSLTQKEFKEKAKGMSLWKNPLIIARGGILGLITLNMYNRLLNFLEIQWPKITKMEMFDSETKLKKFIYSVNDDAHILYKLEKKGYFERSN